MGDTVSLMSVSFGLFVAYFALSLYIGLQMGLMIYYRHKLRSFQMGFFIQCFIWSFLRTLYFLLYNIINRVHWLDRIIYWIPFNLQFCTFSFLVVYYAHLHQKQKAEWKDFKKKYISFWAIINLLFFLFQLALIITGIVLNDPEKNEEDPQWLSSVHLFFNGIVFFVLVIVLAWQGWKIAQLMRTAMGNQTKLLAKISFRRIAVVTLTLFVLFTSRTVYDILSAVDPNVVIEVSGDATMEALLTFVLFFFWEIVPTILVLVLFGLVRTTNLGAFSRQKPSKNKSSTPSRPRTPLAAPSGGVLSKAHLFNDPRRYDSDEETSPFLKTSGNISLSYNNTNPSPTGPHSLN